MSSIESAEAGVIRSGIWPYVQIARVDHWFKNSFMVLGVLLAVFYQPDVLAWSAVPRLALAVIATCFIASSNYVLNELLDAPMDRLHPVKRFRPVPSGRVNLAIGFTEWIALGLLGGALALRVNPFFALSALSLWVMGVLYNVPPVRTKEWPYIDVLSESINNPIRLLLGWFALLDSQIPPVSLTLSYWMIGAYFMATKRFAELRHINDAGVAAAYRHSFKYYTEPRLLVSMLFYATACAFFAGIFVVRYHLELILFGPLAAGLFSFYLSLGFEPDSPTQNPEHLYRHKAFVAYLIVCFAAFVVLMFTEIPVLYEWFNVQPSAASPLWRVG